MVTLVEQHVIQAGDPCYEEIDAAAFAAKTLYNLGNYTIRQSWLSGDGHIPYARLYHLLKETEAYQALPRKVSQLVLKQLDQNWRSFFPPCAPGGSTPISSWDGRVRRGISTSRQAAFC